MELGLQRASSILICRFTQRWGDYRIQSGSSGQLVAGGSAFNINAASLQLGGGGLDRAEVEALLGQHTAEFGQEFEPAAIERLFTQTAGQPWLVNALCEEACFKDPQGRDRSHAITENDILAAQEVLLQRQVVHLNRLADRLHAGKRATGDRAHVERSSA